MRLNSIRVSLTTTGTEMNYSNYYLVHWFCHVWVAIVAITSTIISLRTYEH